MKSDRPAWRATAIVACLIAAAPRVLAQGTATVDFGFADVRYDGFLPSSAGSVSPAFHFERPRVMIAGRASYLHFESGRHSLQGNLAFSAFTNRLGRFRGELSGGGGGSRYAQLASFSHLLVGPRIHYAGSREGAWIGGNIGSALLGDVHRPVTALTTGVWAERLAATWLVTTTVTKVGDSAYTDIEGTTHLPRGQVTLDGMVGIRGWSRGGGHGVYAEGSAALRLRSWVALVLSGGRYPTDPIRGSVSGRYANLAIRLTALPWRPLPLERKPLPRITPQWSSAADGTDPAPVTIEVLPCRCADRTLVVHAGDAAGVEVSGDFTDWEPQPLSLTGPATWSLRLSLAPGSYRFNVRIDGGEWMVPAGVTRLTDEFGGQVGLLTIR